MSGPLIEIHQEAWHPMANHSRSDMPGKFVFYITLVATVAFFWWLLIYDHGVTPIH